MYNVLCELLAARTLLTDRAMTVGRCAMHRLWDSRTYIPFIKFSFYLGGHLLIEVSLYR